MVNNTPFHNPSKLTSKEVLHKLLTNPRYYVENCLKIRDVNKRLIPFLFNHAQEKLYKTIRRAEKKGRLVRVNILKARRLGMSTLIQGLIFHDTATHQNVKSVITAHTLGSSRAIFNISELFYDSLPPAIRPMKRYGSKREMLFENPDDKSRFDNPGLRSSIQVETAKSVDLGRAPTIHKYHASEVAYYPNAKDLMLGIFQAVPETRGSAIYLETTANGASGWFYDHYQKTKRGENQYIHFFYPWHEFPGYRIPDAKIRKSTFDQEELRLIKVYGLSHEQLAWRRYTIANKCDGDVTLFQQEYPSDDHEAFIFSGRNIFPTNILKDMLDSASIPQRGDLSYGPVSSDTRYYKTRLGSKPSFREDPHGKLRIWSNPHPNHSYTIGVDVAEGRRMVYDTTAAEGSSSDFSVLDVFDSSTLEQAAQWHGHIDPDELGVIAVQLALYYNDAFIIPEVNNHGLTTVTEIYKKLQYRNVYIRESYSKQFDTMEKSVGWKTTQITKPLLIDLANECIRERVVRFHDKHTIEEFMAFVRHDDGSMGAQSGHHDDRVIAAALALWGARDTIQARRPDSLSEEHEIPVEDIQPGTLAFIDAVSEEASMMGINPTQGDDFERLFVGAYNNGGF